MLPFNINKERKSLLTLLVQWISGAWADLRWLNAGAETKGLSLGGSPRKTFWADLRWTLSLGPSHFVRVAAFNSQGWNDCFTAPFPLDLMWSLGTIKNLILKYSRVILKNSCCRGIILYTTCYFCYNLSIDRTVRTVVTLHMWEKALYLELFSLLHLPKLLYSLLSFVPWQTR